ncbi:MAG TPA: serpin family protein [Streptosporangiaceae bacterium]
MRWHRSGRHRTAALAALACVAVLAAGCGQSRSSASPGEQTLVGRVEQLAPSGMSPAQVTAAEDQFSLALFRRVCPSAPGPNLLLSPESAAEALGMLYAGAKGPAAASLGRLLRLPAWTPGLVAALDRHTAALAGLHQVAVSNHLFEQSGARPAPRVLDDLRTAFRTGVGVVDFADEPTTTNRINAVVARETRGLVPTLFAAPLPSSTQVVLTNALYLKAPWRHPFPATSPAPFHTGDGRVVQVPLMSSDVPVASYRQAGGWQSATLPYAGGRLAAVALLPPARATGCAAPTLAQWMALTAGHSTEPAGVRLPRLDLSQTWDDLQAPLAAMGLPLSGDYTGLGAADTQISEVVQDDTMHVSPAGTTAAAATGVAVGTAESVPPPLTLTFDRPFLLLLEDTATHTPLFLAQVTDPAQP